MTEKFYFDFFQIPHTGVNQPDLDSARTDKDVAIRQKFDMRLSNFGALNVGGRMTSDYTRTLLSFKTKDELADINVITEDVGVGQNVPARGTTTVHNPYLWGSTVKYVRDDQFIRMTMSKDTGTSTEATQVELPMFDVMDTKESTAGGINATSNANMKNWPAEGWRSFGGKYDFLPYAGGTLK